MPNYQAAFVRDPVDFLTKHPISIEYRDAKEGVNQWVIEREFEKSPILLRLARTEDTDTFAAYFLPYTAGESHQTRLGISASIMITPPMTGCTLVIENKWYTPMVSHHNRQTEDEVIDQPAIDDAVKKMHGSKTTTSCCRVVANYYALRKSDYIPEGENQPDNCVYVFGVLGKTGWTFYRMKHLSGYKVKEPPTRIN